MKDQALAERCRRLRLVLTDVDGVMTDGTILLLPGGEEGKSFHIRDGLGIVMAHRAGLMTGILSARRSEVTAQRAAELGMKVVRQGMLDKASELRKVLDELSLEGHEVAYIGDDVNDLPVMELVGLSAAPADAPLEVRGQAFMVMEAAGGRGCLREFLEAILRARGDWDRVVAGA